jgi:hypothetical protein
MDGLETNDVCHFKRIFEFFFAIHLAKGIMKQINRCKCIIVVQFVLNRFLFVCHPMTFEEAVMYLVFG